MSDPDSKPLGVAQDTPSPDWQAAGPTLKIRWLIGITLVVPMLLAAGVYLLQHFPTGVGLRITDTADTVIEVHLIPQQERKEPSREATQPPPSLATPNPQPERLIEDPDHSIPEEAAAATPSNASLTSPAIALPAPSSSAAVPKSQMALMFQRTLLSHIARYRRYPDEARRQGAHGTVQMVFAMRRDGTVTDVWIKSSSGYKILDAAAIDTIRKAQPLPKIPAELPDQLNILVPVAFDLP